MQPCQVESLFYLDPGFGDIVPVVLDDLVGLFAEGIGSRVSQYAETNKPQLSIAGFKVDENRSSRVVRLKGCAGEQAGVSKGVPELFPGFFLEASAFEPSPDSHRR